MISKKEKDKILLELDEKQIRKEYKQNIIKYIQLNHELFPFLDINEVTKRILYNFSNVSLNMTSFLYKDYGQYIPTTGKILLSPTLFFGKNKRYKESVFLHELDHCACTPTKVKKKYIEFKNKIKREHRILYNIIPDFASSEFFIKVHYEGPISGIVNLNSNKEGLIQKMLYGTSIENYLNEGITSLKQKIYSEKLNIDFHKNKDFLYMARKAAECLGNIIGFENMIYNHFYNNFDNIENDFFKRTNIKLEVLISKFMICDKTNSKNKIKELDDFIEKIYLKIKNKAKYEEN